MYLRMAASKVVFLDAMPIIHHATDKGWGEETYGLIRTVLETLWS